MFISKQEEEETPHNRLTVQNVAAENTIRGIEAEVNSPGKAKL